LPRSKSDRDHLTPREVACLQVKLVACPGCFRIRRSSHIKPDGTCLWCHEQVTPEFELQVEEEKLEFKRIRAKLDRIRAKQEPNLVIIRRSSQDV